ncbi:MAG TPA: alanine--tRNA ligase [Phycisphaerae bacterium]|nr:alanine--tRNA ligase [Phycisphaerae bacterium]
MNQRTSAQIRREFIEYFEKKCGHTFVPSSPCVPVDDPTLMFTNAGMNQFKPIFLGQQAPDVDRWPGARAGLPTRAANTQKCIRAGGKHNDLDDVGHDTYHHTFFEMLGNWSFGDYFKKEAIAWAWDLLTNVWGLDPERLHATYFQGDAAEGLEPDTEARELWLKILPKDRVHPGNKKDNFWEMGDTGPCGPCSEIHIDLTPDKSGAKLVNAGDARVMEIWNLVFIQFNRGGDGKLTPLPARHVDTGMGFERICSVIQGMERGQLGKFSNYDTDVFAPIFAAIQRVTGAEAYAGLLEGEGTEAQRHKGTKGDGAPEIGEAKARVMKDVAYRVVADHIRTLTFALTDGAIPSNEGRGFVLRRILRRAVRYGRQYLGTREPFMCKLVPAVAEAMGAAFPELRNAHGGKNVEHVSGLIRDEEASFIKTLDRGIALFNDAAEHARTHNRGRISGEDAFKLHDTFGFPIDLTELMAEEQGLAVDIGDYERLMEEAREKARQGKGGVSDEEEQLVDHFMRNVSAFPKTDDSFKYSATRLQAKIERILTHKAITQFGEFCESLKTLDETDASCGLIIVDRTCLYAEQGGQVGDSGLITGPHSEFRVERTLRAGDVIAHFGKRTQGMLKQGEVVTLTVDRRRTQTMQNHTATHVMNWALREVLGDHVQQKGSMVDDEKTRFDLSHPSHINEDELTRIEWLVNERIERMLAVHAKEVAQKDALKIHGLRAVFGEKYPERVRVVSIGPTVEELLADPGNEKWRQFSVEFCGGTHLKHTGEAGRFRLIEESAVAKGIRRVTGVTGDRAKQVEQNATTLAGMVKSALNADPASLPQRIGEITGFMADNELPVVDRLRLRADIAQLQEKAKQAQKQAAKAGVSEVISHVDDLLAGSTKIGGVSVICGTLSGTTADQLRAASDSLRSRAGSAAVLLASDEGGRATLLAAMTPDVVKKGVRAGDLIKEIAPIVGGKGGGRPDMAQGGGADASKIADAVNAARAWLLGKIA